MTNLVVRQSDHINEDLKRNWSSWNYGQEGIDVTLLELEDHIETMGEEDSIHISGFELNKEMAQNSQFGELYQGYTVLIDQETTGLCINYLDATSIEDAVKEVTSSEFRMNLETTDSEDCSNAKLVWSCPNNEIHIIQL